MNTNPSHLGRRRFMRHAALGGLAVGLGSTAGASSAVNRRPGQRARNLIFLVVDGCNHGTLGNAQALLGMQGSGLHWFRLGADEHPQITRGLMETCSANSLVTDSAAAGSAWGCGYRINNGAVNIRPDGSTATPIMVQAKGAGMACGLVTTTRITHATPASFAANVASRSMEDTIADQYLEREIDVLLGGGAMHFKADQRGDGADLLESYRQSGYAVLESASGMTSAPLDKPWLGLFAEDHLPYAIDRVGKVSPSPEVPSLPLMMRAALSRLSREPSGFILQVEGGRVDHAGHANDPGAILADMIEFDTCIPEALSFCREHPDTLVILTTDHGTGGFMLNGMGPSYALTNTLFAEVTSAKASYEMILSQVRDEPDPDRVVARVEALSGLDLTDSEEGREAARIIHEQLKNNPSDPLRHLHRYLAPVAYRQWGLSWTSQQHTGEPVELLAWGPGSEGVSLYQENRSLHGLMIEALGLS